MSRLRNGQHERFCRAFIVELNGARAARRAGYSVAGSRVRASKLLTKANVIARIGELQNKVETEIEDDAKRIRNDLRAMSRVKITDIYNNDHTIKPFSEMTEGALLLIVCFKYKMGELTEVKVLDKLKAIELLGKHHEVAAWKENVNVHEAGSRVERMRRYQKRIGKRGRKRDDEPNPRAGSTCSTP